MGLFSKKKEKHLTRIMGDYKGDYTPLGGLSIPNCCVKAFSNRLEFCNAIGKSLHSVDYDNVIDVSLKTEEEVSKDVTLTRLAVFGLFAFGMKKRTREEHRYLIIKTKDDDFENVFVMQTKFGKQLEQMFVQTTRKAISEYRNNKATE